MTDQKIFNPGNHRDAPERALKGSVVTILVGKLSPGPP